MTRTYQIKYDFGKQSFKFKARRICALALLYAVSSSVLSLFPWFRDSHRPYLWTFVSALISGLFSGILFAFLFTLATKGFREYELHVAEDSLTANYGYFERTIKRGELRTVKEYSGSVLRPAALILSKYGSFGTRMWGCIWIPRESAEYEQLWDRTLMEAIVIGAKGVRKCWDPSRGSSPEITSDNRYYVK